LFFIVTERQPIDLIGNKEIDTIWKSGKQERRKPEFIRRFPRSKFSQIGAPVAAVCDRRKIRVNPWLIIFPEFLAPD
jgi:hypothetical protein